MFGQSTFRIIDVRINNIPLQYIHPMCICACMNMHVCVCVCVCSNYGLQQKKCLCLFVHVCDLCLCMCVMYTCMSVYPRFNNYSHYNTVCVSVCTSMCTCDMCETILMYACVCLCDVYQCVCNVCLGVYVCMA